MLTITTFIQMMFKKAILLFIIPVYIKSTSFITKIFNCKNKSLLSLIKALYYYLIVLSINIGCYEVFKFNLINSYLKSFFLIKCNIYIALYRSSYLFELNQQTNFSHKIYKSLVVVGLVLSRLSAFPTLGGI